MYALLKKERQEREVGGGEDSISDQPNIISVLVVYGRTVKGVKTLGGIQNEP